LFLVQQRSDLQAHLWAWFIGFGSMAALPSLAYEVLMWKRRRR